MKASECEVWCFFISSKTWHIGVCCTSTSLVSCLSFWFLCYFDCFGIIVFCYGFVIVFFLFSGRTKWWWSPAGELHSFYNNFAIIRSVILLGAISFLKAGKYKYLRYFHSKFDYGNDSFTYSQRVLSVLSWKTKLLPYIHVMLFWRINSKVMLLDLTRVLLNLICCSHFMNQVVERVFTSTLLSTSAPTLLSFLLNLR